MEAPERQHSFSGKTMTKQSTGRWEDTPLHVVARVGNLELAMEILANVGDAEVKQLLSKQNHSGETALYVAAEHGSVDLVKEMMKYYDIGLAEILKVLTDAIPELSMTVDLTNTTALHTAAAQGHIEVVNFLLEKCSNLATIARSNGKTALHSAARHGHLEVVRALLRREPGIATRIDKKRQTALHMAVKGHSTELVDELVNSDPSLINMMDTKGNTALHISARKGRAQIVSNLLAYEGMEKLAINKSGETALDTAEKTGHSEVALILREHGVQNANSIKPPTTNTAQELKQTVSDIKYGVHNQLEHTWQTRKRVQGIAKRLNKMHSEGLNNAINSTTVVAVLIATVAFAAIFNVPGQFADDPKKLPPNYSSGEAEIAPTVEFMIFIIFDSTALFISLAVVVVQTSIIVIERKAKKKMMAVINKLMWLACVLISVAFLALSYLVVGKKQRSLAVAVTGIGTVIMSTTLGTMCYWVIVHRIEASKLRSIRRSSRSSRSQSWSVSAVMSESEILSNEYKTVYAI
ncbi:hypothetical protein CJ030_MR2G006823 [Morella rubra]|uniref:PGG domain-containing protein n=2 Tax=Morella rubra TaxID=262757 RepID=A0A6A1W9R2_9ROSI|nr:hypothetical protein CJ030_MR2G006823 [Morella rubra]